MVITYYIKLFRTGPDKHNGILMSLLLLVAETSNGEANGFWYGYVFILYTKP